MAKVVKRDYEDLDSLLRRFKRKVNDDMILADMKKHEYYRSPMQKKREKRKNALLKRQKQEKMKQFYANNNKEDRVKQKAYDNYTSYLNSQQNGQTQNNYSERKRNVPQRKEY